MKAIMKLGIIALVVGLAVSAFAATSSNINLRDDATVSGTKLKAGEYKVTIEGTGPEVKVTFLQRGEVKATATAKLAQDSTRAIYDTIVYRKTADGIAVSELRLAKLKTSYVKFD